MSFQETFYEAVANYLREQGCLCDKVIDVMEDVWVDWDDGVISEVYVDYLSTDEDGTRHKSYTHYDRLSNLLENLE